MPHDYETNCKLAVLCMEMERHWRKMALVHVGTVHGCIATRFANQQRAWANEHMALASRAIGNA